MSPASPGQFVLTDFTPAYTAPEIRDDLKRRVALAHDALRACRSCPRECGVDRLADEVGVCQTGRHALVSSAFPHLGEEACLRGSRGSGTIFFAGCNLHCVFCQNWDISQGAAGQPTDASRIADAMLALQDQGSHNINLVTPEHVVPQAIEALAAAIDQGLRLPIVYNTSAYDSLESLRLMDGLIDIYMPDFKFWSPDTAERLLHAADYPERARDALREMHRQVGVLKFTPAGLACRGVLVRHLVMPGQTDDSSAIFKWLAEELSPDTYVNIMAQYHPAHEVGRPTADAQHPHADINRPPTAAEISAAYASARDAGLWRFDKDHG